jgi:beta-mannosidase
MHQSLVRESWFVRVAEETDDVPVELTGRDVIARVPGCVHTDLMRAGLIGHPNVGFNEDGLRWIGRADWCYHCRFVADPKLFDEDQIDLVCEGLDTVAAIELNGIAIGTACNMHHPHRFGVREALQDGENELRVRFGSPLRHIRSEEARLGRRPVNGDWDPYPFLRKCACNFGWDWGPRVPTVGIWRDIRLHGWSHARLVDVRPLIRREQDGGDWLVDVCVSLEWADGRDDDENVRLIAELRDGAEMPAERAQPVSPGFANATVTLRVARPELWWPYGYGEQPLYALDVRLVRSHGSGNTGARPDTLDQWAGRIGFRTVRLHTDADDIGSAFAIEINGRAVFCKGANWIPDGLFPTDLAADDYRHRVEQAVGANMNMLRVWGGGLYESPAFYAACDEMGVLVWQDFLFACATYPEEEPYWAQVEAEARHNVARLSQHPSVVLWCGGNECIWAYESWGFKKRLSKGQSWGRRFYLELLPEIVDELDPTRPYWPNSPFSGSLHVHPLDEYHGNRHTWDVRMEGYRDFVPRFVSEFGHQSPPNYATLKEAVGDEELAIESESMRHRQRAGGGNERQYDEPMKIWFAAPSTFSDWHYLAQVLQARSITLGIEWLRAHMPRCMGTLYWQLNDCWAGHSWSAVDAAGRRKPLWYATRRAYAPRLITIHPVRGRPMLFAVNDTDTAWDAVAHIRRLRFDGDVLDEAQALFTIRPRTAETVAEVSAVVAGPGDAHTELITADVDNWRAFWYFMHDRKLAYPTPRWSVRVERHAGGVRVQVDAHSLLRDIVIAVDRLDPTAEVDEQMVTLLPGESRTFEIRTQRELDIEALTTPPVFQCVNPFGANHP